MNKLFGRKGLVKVSSTPGKTANINFFEADGIHFVDLPGYGFAQRSKAERGRWAELIGDFLESERSFNLVVSLVDIRHDPSKLDFEMIEYLREGGFKLRGLPHEGRQAQEEPAGQAAREHPQATRRPADNIIVTSSQTGVGIDALKRRIEEDCLGDEDGYEGEEE